MGVRIVLNHATFDAILKSSEMEDFVHEEAEALAAASSGETAVSTEHHPTRVVGRVTLATHSAVRHEADTGEISRAAAQL